MVAASTAPRLNGLVINVGSGTETSLRALTKLVVEVTSSQANVVYNAQTTGGVSRLCANLTLAEQKLSYKPAFSLEEGLRLMLARDPRFKAPSNVAV
jgi:UDP-glucose 4-epimerase